MTWKNTWKKIKELNNLELKTILAPDYVFNKKVFGWAMGFLFIYFLILLVTFNFDFSTNFYYNCPENQGICSNPFFNTSYCPGDNDFCSSEYFFPGYTIGEPMNPLIQSFPLVVLFVFVSAFIYNHFLFNKYNKRRITK